MVDNSNMPHPKCLGSQKNPGTEPKTCEKGPKLGFEYLPTSKTSHCVRTACMAFPNTADYRKPLTSVGNAKLVPPNSVVPKVAETTAGVIWTRVFAGQVGEGGLGRKFSEGKSKHCDV